MSRSNLKDLKQTPVKFDRRFLLSDPHICAVCAGQGLSCCKLRTGNEQNCFPLSEPERQRIISSLEDDSVFWEPEPNSRVFLHGLRNLFPESSLEIKRIFPAHGFHLRLATTPDGRCLLLGDKGCILPRQARPWYCRLFPFWVQFEKIILLDTIHCLAGQQGIKKAMLDIDMDAYKIQDIFSSLLQDWGFKK